MTATLVFRGLVPSDRAFILDTWTRSAGKACRAPHFAGAWLRAVAARPYGVIRLVAEDALSNGRVLLLVDGTDPDTIAGWVAYDSMGPIWAYVLAPLRGRGLWRKLRQEALQRGLWTLPSS